MFHRMVLVLLCWANAVFAAEEWPGVKFVEVRAYAWPVVKENAKENVIRHEDMTLEAGVLNKDGALLTPGQVKRLVTAVAESKIRHPVAKCYEPHHAFVFYDLAKKPVAFIEVCFICHAEKFHPESPGAKSSVVESMVLSSVDLPAIATILGEVHLFDDTTFNNNYSKMIKAWEEKLKINFAAENSEMKPKQGAKDK